MALFGNNNRHSVLDDNSPLYQKQEIKSEKQKWSEMDAKQRLRYFKDYYLLKCVIVSAIIITTSIVLWSIWGPRKETELFVAVIQNTLVPKEKENLAQKLNDLFITDPDKQDVKLDDTFYSKYDSETKFAAYLNAREIDLIITNEEYFKELASTNAFDDLYETMPKFAEKNKDLLYWTQGYVEEEASMSMDIDNTTNKNTNDKNKHAFGIKITNTSSFHNAWNESSEAVIGVVKNSEQKENAKKALEEILIQ